jgi:hypothetical protein
MIAKFHTAVAEYRNTLYIRYRIRDQTREANKAIKCLLCFRINPVLTAIHFLGWIGLHWLIDGLLSALTQPKLWLKLETGAFICPSRRIWGQYYWKRHSKCCCFTLQTTLSSHQTSRQWLTFKIMRQFVCTWMQYILYIEHTLKNSVPQLEISFLIETRHY